jgi:saccharopine dehydrogenase (NADP+, L-glutamate forming)
MSKRILVLGAGKSATVLIQYLQKQAIEHNWYIVLADSDINLANKKWNHAKNGHAVGFDIQNEQERANYINDVDIVVSMLPATLHYLVAIDCLKYLKSLFTASYVDDNLRKLVPELEEKKLLFLCEMGLDPGIDHMSAMELIHRIQNKGGVITDFKSHCGGLIAPESDNNPWHYKISWNPKNIILAGKAGALFLEDGTTKEMNYATLFVNAPKVHIPNYGYLSYYPNRNSLTYIDTYGLKSATNFKRTTLRNSQFCQGWAAIIQLGLTTENTIIRTPNDTIQSWFNNHLNENQLAEIYQRLLLDNDLKTQIQFLNFDSRDTIPLSFNTNASILQWILEAKWKLDANDKDLVIMLHEISYVLDNKNYEVKSSMIVKGENVEITAMAKTVGLPLAMAVCAFLKGEIALTGLQIPTHPSIYKPILKSLENEGIYFDETGSHSKSN